jgi:NAD+--dinitrogen-reductase ADP-D-ribosyltransferase
MDHDTAATPRWYTTNLVSVPAPVLASVEFNAQPRPLVIAGTLDAHRGLFQLLEGSTGALQAYEIFAHYMDLAFGLRKPGSEELRQLGVAEQRRWRSSWYKLLQGWGMDSNGPSGAVLKGWVESRFGLVPDFHKATLGHFPSPAWVSYLQEKSASRYNNNSIHQQLDLLYAYAQWALQRQQPQSEQPQTQQQQHLRLWRGTNQCEEQVVAGRLKDRRCTVRLNNLVSFSLSQEEASCFGDWILEVQVPLCKVLVFPRMLPGHVLRGEQEVIALGGHYAVEAHYV